jgi:hypothetical protein
MQKSLFLNGASWCILGHLAASSGSFNKQQKITEAGMIFERFMRKYL